MHSLYQYWGIDSLEPDRLDLNYYLSLQQIVMPDVHVQKYRKPVKVCLVIDQPE